MSAKKFGYAGFACLFVLIAAMLPMLFPVAASLAATVEFPLAIVCWGVAMLASLGAFVCFGMRWYLTTTRKND